ncbi:MAG: sigma-54-dependent Fis family transcriptional regulator [Calditrichaeota bacterium]|nr:sigma-54-dependent Fis family transcriptional regulator [Calditrichota bacterium]
MPNILLVDDDINLARVISFQLKQQGFKVIVAHSGTEGLDKFKQSSYDIVISDIQMPDLTGIELLRKVRDLNERVVFILITAYGSVDQAIKACQLGADDYLTKPFSKEQLIFTIEKALKIRCLEDENLQLKQELGQKFKFENLVVHSEAMEQVMSMAMQVANSNASILILGESGTGKELIARAIHYNSPRKEKPLITVNCPSIPDHLMESELFGHVKGAFTGAVTDRRGKFELANGGTIFLDEIGDLKPELQSKLLRVLQEREFERVGENRPIKTDVRIIAATNRDLLDLVNENKFREDLYYRLSVVPITIPPLRERTEEIPHLVEFFLKRYAGKNNFRLEPRVMDYLQAYKWPGNVRELENTIERMVILAQSSTLSVDDLPEHIKNYPTEGDSLQIEMGDDGISFQEVEKRVIEQTLRKTGGNQTKAAELLKIPRHVLIYKMKKLGIGK